MLENVLRNFKLFVDGQGFFGRVDQINPPNLEIQTESYRGGGQDAPQSIDMGMNELTASFVFGDIPPTVYARFGLLGNTTTTFVARGAVFNPTTMVPKPIKLTMGGKVTGIEQGQWAPGERTPTTVNLALTFYEMIFAGAPIHHIDVLNGIRSIGGVDQLAAMRPMIGG